MTGRLTIALISDVFFSADGAQRLMERLRVAKSRGATLAVLPEIPLNPWSPATPIPRDEDAEPAGGPRHQTQAHAARDVGIALIGGAIVRDARTGTRHNTALVFDANGSLVSSYRKVHLPDEPGFHEPCHYAPGTEIAPVVADFGLPLGVQICSDINRPQGTQLLSAMGAMAVVNPRATEAATFERWKLVFRANALTSTTYVLSVNRPAPEAGVPLGGPSIVVDPNGDVIAESADPMVVVELHEGAVREARRRYPGYLAADAALYARGWLMAAQSVRSAS